MNQTQFKNIFQPKKSSKHFLIKAYFEENKNKNIFQKENYIFDDVTKNESYVYLGSLKKFNIKKLNEVLLMILNSKERNYQFDIKSFLSQQISEKDFIKTFIYMYLKIVGKVFNLKTNKEKNNLNHILLTNHKSSQYEDDYLIAIQMNEIRYLQNCAPNILTINEMTKYVQNLAKTNKSLKLTTLNHQDMLKLNMNLITSVNLGSNQKTKLLVLEYLPNKNSKQKITFVGKGIIFDSGGYNLKTGKHMNDMKFDMSGAAIAAILVDTLSKLKIKQNVACVIPLTDNLVDSNAQVPESIWTSMSGKTVEVANTDAEGRLILADAITYSAKNLNSSLIIDLATLTGTVLYALGRYTGAWSTNDNYWQQIEKSANAAKELIWRMPLDDLYIENLNKNTSADIMSCSNTEYPDSNIAAAWLNQFALGKDYIHLDIAGSADINSQGQAPMFKTLINFVKSFKSK